MFYVYILYSQEIDKYYIGQTYDLNIRLLRHKLSTTRFTKRAKDWILVYSEQFETRSEAIIKERYIKSQKSRTFIEELIAG